MAEEIFRSEKGNSPNVEIGSPSNDVNDTIMTPYVGMTFKTSEDAKEYYEKYGVSKGFSVLRRSSQKTWARCDTVTTILYVCSHFGSYNKPINESVPKQKQRPNTSTMRGECQAQMKINLNPKTLEWVVRQVHDEHNHSFVSPSKKMLLKTNRKMPEAAKSMVEMFRKENLPVNKVKSIFGGDNIGFSNRACWNHLRDVRQKIDVGDAQWAFEYFQKRQLENPQFYYAIQCDGEGRAVNFFWVDARSRLSYQQFGDVVSFDTTYKTNKYKLPFAPFTGVNHHFQTIQFGCALLQDETENSFIWLFETWKNAMGGVAPVSLITDSDLAMRAAIPKVFPNTRHRLCYWHIKKKFGEKLGHVYFKKSSFKKDMKKCLKKTYRVVDFEKSWGEIMIKYELTNNSWLEGLYQDRAAWVPVYNRTTFFAGMSSSGRSEGINAFFKDYINSKTDLKEFVEKYEQALKRIEAKERDEDYESEQKYRLFIEKSYMLYHARSIYTRKIFEKFKTQWLSIDMYKCSVVSDDPSTHIVMYKRGDTDHWMVTLDPQTLQGTCECHLFEFIGIPCTHILKVFSKLDLDEIPEFFIKQRWLKGANLFRSADKIEVISQEQTEALRLNHLCQEATQWACIAYKTEEVYNMFLDGIKELGKKVAQFKPSKVDSGETQVNNSIDPPPQILLDPQISITKGRNKDDKEKGHSNLTNNDERYKSPIEISQDKKKRNCLCCNTYANHNSRTCPKRLKVNDQGTTTMNETFDLCSE